MLDRDPCLIWEKLAEDFSKVTPAEKSSARMAFLTLKIPSSESYLDTKHRFDELLRQVAVQGGTISEEDQLGTLLNALPKRFDMLKESFAAREHQPDINFIWTRMHDIETTQKRRAAESGASALAAETYYQNRGGRGASSSRGGRGAGRGAGRGRGIEEEKQDESCFRCGEIDH